MSWFGSVRKKILCKWNLHLPTKSWLPVYWLLHQRTLAISLSQCLAVVQKILFSGPGAVEDLGIFPLNLPSPLATLQPLQQTLEAPNWIKIWISSGSTIIPKYKEWTPKIIPKLNLGGSVVGTICTLGLFKKNIKKHSKIYNKVPSRPTVHPFLEPPSGYSLLEQPLVAWNDLLKLGLPRSICLNKNTWKCGAGPKMYISRCMPRFQPIA